MDALLQKPASELADERRAMFALIDRFSSAIEEYQEAYALTIRERDQEIQWRYQGKRHALSLLKEAYADKQEELQKKKDQALKDIQQNIASCERQTELALRDQENKLSDFENKEKAALDKAYEEDLAEINACEKVSDYVQGIYSKADRLLGKTITGTSRMKKICEGFIKPEAMFMVKGTALEDAGERKKRDADNLYKTISEITASFPKKVIFYEKRSGAIRELGQICASAKEAVRWLRNESARAQEYRRVQSERRCSNMRSYCQKARQQLEKREKDTAAAFVAKIGSTKRQYQEMAAKARDTYDRQYKEQDKYHDTQIDAAYRKWKDELERCSHSFSAKMEEIYPAQRMDAWLSQFWRHPVGLGDYNQIQSPALNVMIGLAHVEISDWMKGDGGAVIKKVLSRYLCLFGRNRKEAEENYKNERLCLPYSLSIEEGQSLLLSYEDQAEERAKAMVNAIGMRMLRSVPACQMRFQLFDVSGIGAFGKLMSLDPAIRNNPGEPSVKSFAIGENGNVHSSSADIAKQMAETKMMMDDLSRQLVNYGSIRAFNARNPLSQQIYRPILMMNFPLGLSVRELGAMNAMTADCSKWGFSMILAQPDRAVKTLKPEIKEALDELRKKILCIRVSGHAKTLKAMNTSSPVERKADIGIYPIPDGMEMENIAREIRAQSVKASRVLINFTDAKGIFPRREEQFKGKADNGVAVPVGYLEGGQVFRIPFDDRHVHTLVMGNTGSGKTNLLHVLMTNLMLRYPPEEVRIYLIDFKYGLDFRVYTQYNLPNFTTISINNDPEFVLGMLQNLEKEQEYRSGVMGSRYQKISDYNAANPKNRLNRIILIIDELYELAKQAADTVQKSILQKIDSFAHQTRAFGIHMVLCGQDLDKIGNFETIKNQCITRIALHCGDAQVKMLMDDAGVARMHSIDAADQGACVFSLSGGSNPQIEHTTYLGADQQERLLSAVSRLYVNKKIMSKVKILLTKVSDNPNHIFQKYVNHGVLDGMQNNRLLLGEAMSMERELLLAPSGNLWILGGHSSEKAFEAGNSLVFFSALSLLLAKLESDRLDIFCTNCGDQPMRGMDEEEIDLAGQMASKYSRFFQYSKGEQFGTVLEGLLSVLEGRMHRRKAANRAIWWILIRPEMINGIDDNSTQIIDFKELLQQGPKYNMHAIVWNADPKRAQVLQMGKELFGDKICLEMPSEDWKSTIGSEPRVAPADYKAFHIGSHTALFRVYDLPDKKWMNRLFARLGS